jgi:hypothetical protein
MLATVMVFGSAVITRAEYGEYEYEHEYEHEYDCGYEYEYAYEYDVQEIFSFSSAATGTLFSGGNGITQPFMLANSGDLMALSMYTTGFWLHDTLTTDFFNRADYVMVSDINMSGIFDFLPIGFQQNNAFVGSFNGNDFTVSNLLVNFDWFFVPFGMDISSLGMFGFVHNADIMNINLVNPQVVVTGHSRDNIGFVVGSAANSRISNIHVTNGTMNAKEANQVGGIVGSSTNSIINDVSVTAIIAGINNTGGIAGRITGGSLTNAVVAAAITSANNTGGIAGSATNATVADTTFTNLIHGVNNVGGIVGNVNATTISNSGTTNGTTITATDNVGGVFGYATGLSNTFDNFSRANITARNNVGGIGGNIHITVAGVSLTNSYSAGTINGSENVGGILGLFDTPTHNTSFTLSDTYSHATINANSNAGGIAGNLNWRLTNDWVSAVSLTRNYVSTHITISENRAGGLFGTSNSVVSHPSIPVIRNNFIITDIIAPSAANAVSVIGNGSFNSANNYFSFASTIRGGAIGCFNHATRVHAQVITLPAWWTSTLLIGNSFNVNVIRDGKLPSLRRLGSMEELQYQENIDFAGNRPPILCPDRIWNYVRHSGGNLIVEFNTFGGTMVRDIPGLRTPQDYIVLGESIMFRHNFLDLLPAGAFPFRVNFVSGHVIEVSINILDATPEPPRLSTDGLGVIDFTLMGVVSAGGFDIGICKTDIKNLSIDIYETTLSSLRHGFNIRDFLLNDDVCADYRIIRFGLTQMLQILDTEANIGVTGTLYFGFCNGSSGSAMFRMVG